MFLAAVFAFSQRFPFSICILSVGTLLIGCFPSSVPPSLSTVFISVTGACFSPFHIRTHGAGLLGLASHGSSLHPGTGDLHFAKLLLMIC